MKQEMNDSLKVPVLTDLDSVRVYLEEKVSIIFSYFLIWNFINLFRTKRESHLY